MPITLNGTTGIVTPALDSATPVKDTAPAFSVYQTGTAQSIPSGVATKIILNAKTFDTANAFDSVTNSRFTPLVAGYYQINAQINSNSGAVVNLWVARLYKNGAVELSGNVSSTAYGNSSLSVFIYMNGTTDYLELFATHSTGTSQVIANTATSLFSGFLVRAA